MFRVLMFVSVMMMTVIRPFAQDNTPQPFFMTFVPNVQFAQMYVGLEKGYFAEAGFDFTLEYGNEPDGVELIAAGEREFGLIAGEQVIVARANGRPIVSVYEWFQQYPIVVVTDVNSGIDTPADLAGRRVGVPGRFGATYSGLIALLSAYDLTERDINLQEIGFNAPEVMCVGGVEAATVYGNNEPLQIALRAALDDCDAINDVRVFPVASAADLVSNGLVTSESLMANAPDRVARMVSAFDRSVRDVVNNPAEAYLLSAPYIDNLPLSEALEATLSDAATAQADFLATDPSREAVRESRMTLYDTLRDSFDAEELLQLQVLLATAELWDAEQTGYADTASWVLTQDTLLTMGFLDAPIDVEAAFTNQFLPIAVEES
jgi:NitT/TauT family transport system substrate-binding protein